MASPIRSGLLQAGSGFLGRRISAWYRAGGAPAPVAAYQPKGAIDLATSYVNLVNPGTYNAAPGVAPTFNAATGWTFALSAYLSTGITGALPGTWTMLIRLSDVDTAAGRYAMGTHDANNNKRWWIQIAAANNVYAVGSTGSAGIASKTAGVLAVAGREIYHDGVSAGTVALGTYEAATEAIFIGGRIAAASLIGKIQAVAIYNSVLSSAQVLAVSSAMSLL
jgi:hypothetical protein